jgi:hypothetical protein
MSNACTRFLLIGGSRFSVVPRRRRCDITVHCRVCTAFWLPKATRPNTRLEANNSLQLQTMNIEKDHLCARYRVEGRFRMLVDQTIREQRREARQVAEQRATKHQFQARSSCVLDGRNYRIARRLRVLAKAEF